MAGAGWDMMAAWSVAADVAGAAYGVPAALITSPSRGRGPRPPRAVWAAKKMAVHLAVVLSDCDYAALGRRLGLHKDTVASHCAAIREACAACDQVEALSGALEVAAQHRLRAEQTCHAQRNVA